MKLNIKNIINFSIIFIMLQASNVLALKHKITLASDYRCPYICNEQDPNPGYYIELARKIFAIYDIEVEYVLLPWSEILEKAASGEIDGVLGITQNYSSDLVTARVPQSRNVLSVFTNQNNIWRYDGIDSLKSLKLTMVEDRDLVDDLKQYINVYYLRKPESFLFADTKYASIESIENLHQGLADILIEDEVVVNYYVNSNNSNIKNAGKLTLEPINMYIAFSKNLENSDQYIKMIEEGMNSLINIGDVNYLKKKYAIPY